LNAVINSVNVRLSQDSDGDDVADHAVRIPAQPGIDARVGTATVARHAQWATFLRRHDKVDLGRLSPDER
jgi:hypothetical protein